MHDVHSPVPTQHTTLCRDSRNLSVIENGAVQLIITSPPYWNLKDYGTKAQIGFYDTYENYIHHLNLVWNECYRVLSPGCKLCINIADVFAKAKVYGRYKVIPIREEIIRFCESIGFDYMGAIIWKKITNTTNTSVKFLGSYPFPRNGIVSIDYEFILLFKKGGVAPKPTALQKQDSKLSIEEWKMYFNGHWCWPGVQQKEHCAMFPVEIPTCLIKMFSFTGETVLDPFAGSGTTAVAAKRTGRHSISVDINPRYIKRIQKKLLE